MSDNIPLEQKDRAHLVPVNEWPERQRRAQEVAESLADDIEVPEYEPADDDFTFEETPDEVYRQDTLW